MQIFLESGISEKLILGCWSAIKNLIDDMVRRDSIAFGSKIHHHAMRQDRLGQKTNIRRIDVRTTG